MPGADLQDLDLVIEASRAAAEVARGYFDGEVKSWTKGDQSPVSEADMAVDQMLFETLRAARPDYGWLSEERADGPDRLGCDRVFVVDPIDGTRAFLAGEPGWVISVAVVEAGCPRVGVLVAPVTGETWTAVSGSGATRNGARIAVRDDARLPGARIGSTTRMTREIGLRSEDEPRRSYDKSLARRLALVAAGDYDAALASENARDWDIAAAAVLISEAGGNLTDFEGRAVTFNRADPRHPPLVAAPPSLHAALIDRYRSLSA